MIFVVQLIRLVWRVLWFALTHPLVDAVATVIVVVWLGRAGPASRAWRWPLWRPWLGYG